MFNKNDKKIKTTKNYRNDKKIEISKTEMSKNNTNDKNLQK